MNYQAIRAAVENPLLTAFSSLSPAVPVYFDNIISSVMLNGGPVLQLAGTQVLPVAADLPEPATLALAGLGFAAVFATRRRRPLR